MGEFRIVIDDGAWSMVLWRGAREEALRRCHAFVDLIGAGSDVTLSLLDPSGQLLFAWARRPDGTVNLMVGPFGLVTP